MAIERPSVLAIDDDPENLAALRSVVCEALPGAAVATAPSGALGLSLARAADPDVILLGTLGSGTEALVLCSELRADERLQGIPVLFLAAPRTDRERCEQALAAGADGFFSHPFDAVELTAQLRAMARIKEANRLRRREEAELAALVERPTRELEQELGERRHVEEALRESELRYRALFDNSPDAVLLTVPDGAILSANAAASRIFGWTEAELTALRREDVADVDDPRLPLLLEQRARTGRASGELTLRRKDGSTFTGEVSSLLFRDRTGTERTSMIIRDMTERLRAAEEHARLEDQLRLAQKVEAIGRLAGGVAHDFNNLTAIVLGYGEMLLGHLRPEDPARKWAEQIVAAGRRSATLTRQLLAFSRRQTLQPEILDLNALLRNLEQMLGRLIGEDVELELRLAAGLGSVKADPGQLEQVVTNLVLNARDAMPRGGKLTIETAGVELDQSYALAHESFLPGTYVQLALTDTGSGMDKAALARLFEPFYTTKEKGRGTGLGLATVYGIVKQSGGYIYAYSEPGAGTTFKIYLPRTDAVPEAKPADADGELRRGHGELVLLVEDEAPLRELCETLLARLGYRVRAAGGGRDALRLVEETGLAPDLVVTDVVMPGMSGPELAARLRRTHPGLKVLYISGYPDAAIARHGVLAPGTPFLQKPFTERGLAAKVRELLAAPAAAAAAPPPGRRVLMIDDDEQYRDLVAIFCARQGHRFTGVSDAAAALAALAREPSDVLLVDLNIPGTDGARILREIRAAGHAMPALVLTGDVASADLDLLRPLGVVRALQKTSTGGPLLDAIAEVGAPPAEVGPPPAEGGG